MASQPEQKRYAVLAEGEGLVFFEDPHSNWLLGHTSLKLFNAGNISYSPEMLEKVKAKQKNIPYFSSEADLQEARKRGFRGGWNMSKASVVSVGYEKNIPDTKVVSPFGTINIGYALWAVDPTGNNKPMRVDYAAASISRGEMTGFAEAPLDMYTLNSKGVYVKNQNDYPNVLGSFALVVLDAGSKKKNPLDYEVLLVQRGDYKEIEHLKGTWTMPGGYTEPEYRLSLDDKFMEEDVKGEIQEEAGILPEELARIMPYAFLQDEFETALLWVAFTNLSGSEILGRKLNSEIETRRAVVVKELDSFVKSHYFDPVSRGALEEALNPEKLVGRFIEPMQFFAQKI